MNSMHELSFDIDADGTIKLQQTEDQEYWMTVQLHPCQLREVAERAGLLAPIESIPEWVARRLAKLQAWAASLQSMLQEGGADQITAAARAELLADGIGDLLAELAPAAESRGASQPANQPHDFALEA